MKKPERPEQFPKFGKIIRDKQPIFLITAILLAGTILRLYRLGEGLWLDEIITYVNYATEPYLTIVTTFDSENQHFLYSLFAHTSLLVFGNSAWALRLPAVLLGLGSIFALFLLGKRVTTQTEALLAAALLAFSYHHVWFSQNARGYTGLLFFTLLSSYFLLKGLSNQSTLTWVAYGLSAALGVYTHLTMIFVIIGQFIVACLAVWIGRGRTSAQAWIGFLVGFGSAALGTLILYLPVLRQILATFTSEGNTAISTWRNPVWTLLEVARSIQVGPVNLIILLSAIVVFGTGVYSYALTRPSLIGLAFLPAIIGGISVVAFGHHLWPRFFFFAAGFGVLILIRGTYQVTAWFGQVLKVSGPTAYHLGTIVNLGLICLSALTLPFVYGPKQDFEGAQTFVEANRAAGDIVVTVGLANFPYQNFFRPGWQSAETLDELEQLRDLPGDTWLVYTIPVQLRGASPAIMSSIEQDFDFVAKFPGTLGDGAVYVVRANP